MFLDILPERNTANVYAFGNDNKNVVLVDPGSNSNNHLIRHLLKLELNVVAVLLTHGHYDHIEGLKDIKIAYPNAKIYIFTTEKDFLNDSSLNLSMYFDEEDDHSVIEYDLPDVIEVVDNEILNLSNVEIRVIHTPYHTSGSVCYYIEKENILFSGDSLFARSVGRSDLPTGDARTMNSSLKKLAKLNENTVVYPGHGPKTTIENEKKYNTYLRTIY